MATFLRFTATAQEDIERGTSLFKTGSMNNAEVLPGICAFSFDIEDMTEDEVVRKIKQYAKNFAYYSSCGVAALIEGEYVARNRNSEGVIIEPSYLITEYQLSSL